MLNMKKGLAVALAAATALTFAPVSTLGLNGVVAEAATTNVAAVTLTGPSSLVGTDEATFTVNTKNAAGKAEDANVSTDVNVNVYDASTGGNDKTSEFETPVVTLGDAESGKATVKLQLKAASVPASSSTADYYVQVSVNSKTSTRLHVTAYHDADEKKAAEEAAWEAALSNNAPFGGVSTSIVAVNGATYDLVNPNTKIEADGKTYSAAELTWYLTKNAVKSNVNEYKNITLDAAIGSIDAGKGHLKINVTDASTFASTFASGTKVVAVASEGGADTVVYADDFTVDDGSGDYKLKNYSASASASTAAASTASTDISTDLLDGVLVTGVNNNKIYAADTSITPSDLKESGKNFKLNISNLATGDTDNVFKGAKLTTASAATRGVGTYYETAYVPYTVTSEGRTYVAKIDITVSVGSGPQVEISDGNTVYGSWDPAKVSSDPTIYLDLKTNTTFDITKYAKSNIDGTTYDYSTSSTNVEVKDGVITAKTAGYAKVTVTPKANGVEGTKVDLQVRVNSNGFDSLTVAGQDKDEATVLNYKDFTNNDSKLSDNTFYGGKTAASEEKLAAAQVKYIQIEVKGNETTDVHEAITATSANKANLTYSLADSPVYGESVDEKTGVITIPHSWTTDSNFNSYGFPIKVVSASTDTSAMTTSYFYVVVDYADATLTGLQDSYDIGTSLFQPDYASWLDLNNGKALITNGTVGTKTLSKSDELIGSTIYDEDSSNVFNKGLGTNTLSQNVYTTYKNVVANATVAGRTMHVLVSSGSPTNKVGNAYKVVTLKSVEGKTNYVKKIENVETGKTIYEADGATSGASIVIDKRTVVKVTVAYTPDASLNPKADPAFTISQGTDPFTKNTENVFVAATENPKTYEITLIPSLEGTQVVTINPTQGRLSATDYSLVDSDHLQLAVKYSTAGSQKPSQITGVKLGNKKGANVVVKFNKDNTSKNIKYYVQKKVGNKTSGKSVGSNRTILSVKKGATVKVRVKAYYYDANGEKHVGAWSKWVTKKTDKK